MKTKFDELKRLNWLHEYAENGIVNEADCKRIVDAVLAEYKAKLKESFDELYEKDEDLREYAFKLYRNLIDTTEI